MDWQALLGGTLGAGVFAIVLKLIDVYSNRNKTKSDVTDTVVDTMLEAMQFLKNERADYLPRFKSLEDAQRESEKLIRELTARKEERDTQIAELQEKNDALQSLQAAMMAQIKKDTDETKVLRAEVELLRVQVTEGEVKYKELQKKYDNQKQAIVLLFRANPDLVTPPELQTLLGDSINGLRWNR